MSAKDKKINKLIQSIKIDNLLTYIILFLLSMLIILLIGIYFWQNSLYEQAGREISTSIKEFNKKFSVGEQKSIWIKLYDADTILVINKNSLTGREYIYLTEDCADKVEEIVKDSSAKLIIFWLKSNYELISYYEYDELNNLDIRVFENYFSANVATGFIIGKGHIKENFTNREFLSIK